LLQLQASQLYDGERSRRKSFEEDAMSATAWRLQAFCKHRAAMSLFSA